MANVDSLRARWDPKFQSYLNLIEELKTRVAGMEEMPEGPRDALVFTIDKLLEFGQEQFGFFLEGFSGNHLEESEQEPKEYVLQKILEQIGHDLTVMEQIADDWARTDSIKRFTLIQGTVFAKEALNIAYSNDFLPPSVNPFIYLHKTPVIRVIPYANSALIGIPYTAVNDQNRSNHRDLLAIPHEVGHYVYWNGKHNGEKINDYLEEQLKNRGLSQYAHWLEEIFADVYSAFVGGTATAQSIQDLLSDNRPIFFDLDDGSHPPSIIRPFIYAYALSDNKAIKKGIIDKWYEFLESLGLNTSFKRALIIVDGNRRIQSLTFENIPFGPGAVPDGLQIIQALVELTASIFQGEGKLDRWANTVGEEAYIKVENSEKLKIENFKGSSKHWPTEAPTIGKASERLDVLLEEEKQKNNDHIPSDRWRPVYLASGWTSGGEEDGYHTIE